MGAKVGGALVGVFVPAFVAGLVFGIDWYGDHASRRAFFTGLGMTVVLIGAGFYGFVKNQGFWRGVGIGAGFWLLVLSANSGSCVRVGWVG